MNTKEELSLISSADGIDHIAYATKNTERTSNVFSEFGFRRVIYKREITQFNIFATKLQNSAGDVIELIQPSDQTMYSPVDTFLKNNDCTIYHVCYKVDDFYDVLKRLKSLGAVSATKPFDSYLFDGYISSHLYHPLVGLFEIFGSCKRKQSC